MNANMHGATGRTTGDAGFALPLVVFALVLLGVMGIAGLQSSRDELLSAMAVSNSHRAFYAAEAGIHKAVSNWSQLDTLMDYPGDTLVESWTEVENGCSYQLAYRRIDDGDGLFQFFSIESTGRSPGLNGATRRVGTIMKSYVVVGAGVAYDGTLSISGNPEIRGPCSDVHSNFDINVEGDPKIGGSLSTSGIATGPGSPTDTLNNPIV